MKPLQIVFMGTPDFSVAALENLIAGPHHVLAVVTQPDRQRGRGKKLTFSPVKESAVAHGIPVYQPERGNDPELRLLLERLQPDVLIVIAYGKILPEALLEIPVYGAINVHASILPKYRGAAPIHWAILNGDNLAGVTIMQMDKGMDTGDILRITTLPVNPKETTGGLFDKLSLLGADTLSTVLADLEQYQAGRQKQSEADATYVGKITKDMEQINWTGSAAAIERLIRGLSPAPGAYTLIQGKRLKIWQADVLAESVSLAAGTVMEIGKDYFVIATGEGALRVKEVQPESKRRVPVHEYLQQAPFIVGDCL